jgi:hypothetical protein
MKLIMESWRRFLSEQVFGKQAFVYHGTSAKPDKFIPAVLGDRLVPGGSDQYGRGLYTVFEDDYDTKTFKGQYGHNLYKLKVNLDGFVIFDPEACKKVYGKVLTIGEQLKMMGKESAIEELIDDHKDDTEFDVEKDLNNDLPNDVNWWNLQVMKYKDVLQRHVKGLMFGTKTEGKVAVIYDPSIVVPASYADLPIGGINPERAKAMKPEYAKSYLAPQWQPVERGKLKPAIQRSASGEFTPGRFHSNYNWKLLKQGKAKFEGNLDLSKYKDRKSFPNDSPLPDNLEVGGNLYVNGWWSDGPKLPKGLKVHGDLDIYSSPMYWSRERWDDPPPTPEELGVQVGGKVIVSDEESNYRSRDIDDDSQG